ncbi:MAG TPA: hypothetical protein VD926_06435, partial [Acidimicrobiales bacterium]|nr:hypothetical protein [Acidimicrobiales bacterium]
MTTTERRACLAVFVVLVAVHLGVRDPAWHNATYLAATLGSVVIAWRGVLAHRAAPRAWRLVAAAITLTFVGDLAYGAQDFLLEGSPGDASIADPIWLAGYATLAGALVRLLVPPRRTRQRPLVDVERLLDLGIVLVVATMVVWEVVDLRAVGPAAALLDRVLLAAYPVADLLLVALAVIVLLTDGRRNRAAVHLLAGTGVWLFGDLVFLVAGRDGFNTQLEDLGWFTATWMAGIVLVALGTNQPDVVEVGRSGTAKEPTVGAGRLALAMAPMAVPVLLAVSPHRERSGSFSATLAVGSVLLVLFGYLRALNLLRDRERA